MRAGCGAPCGAPSAVFVAARAARFVIVRPAWARSWRCESSRELTTASEVKCNCVRATERGEEAWSVNREPRYTNRIRGGAGQGEQASDCEALVAKGQAT